jgi:TonB family protein
VVSARVFLNDSLRTANQDQITTQTVSGADDTIKNLNVVLKPLDRPMNEVVVAKTANRKQAPPESYVIIDTLEPTGGWVKFDDYIANNIRRPEEIKDKQISGEVLLSFDIDKNGAPQNITVEKSLCPTCDQEAIRLLKEGPKWEKKKNKKGKVKIRF